MHNVPVEASLSAQKVIQDILSKQAQSEVQQQKPEVNTADVEKFQDALKKDVSQVDKIQASQKSYSEPISNNVGDKILNNLSDLKSDYQATIKRVQSILDRGDSISPSEMVKLQMDLMVMGLKQETVGKITQKSSQNLDSLLKSG